MSVIGVSGPSCSGKSTVALALSERLQDSTVIQQDWFFRDPSLCPPDANFCDLAYLRVGELVKICTDLCGGRAAQVPIIDFGTFAQTGMREIGPTRHTIVEGMTIYRIPELWDLCSYRFYLKPQFSDIEVRKRRRDFIERNKPSNIIEHQLAWVRTEYERDLVTFANSVTFLEASEAGAMVNQILVQMGRQGGSV